MPTPLDEPLYQTSVKLFASDVEWLKRTHGNGWTEVVRDLVREHKKAKTASRIVFDRGEFLP